MSETKRMRRGGSVNIEPVYGGFLVSYWNEDGEHQKIIANGFEEATALTAVAIGLVSYEGHVRVTVGRDG